MPVFASTSYDLAGKKNALFMEVNAGWAKAWRADTQSDIYGGSSYQYDGGLMLNPMLGYRIASGDLRVYVAGGYRYQFIRAYYGWEYASMTMPTKYEYQMEHPYHRFVLNIGFGWR